MFVSYRHGGADKAFATELVSALEADGYRVAIDERDFRANASFLRGNGTLGSREPFHRRADLVALSRKRQHLEEAIICKVLDMGDRQRRLIPMVIEQVAMPAWLYGIVGIDVTKRDPLVDPFDKLKATLGAPLAQRPADPATPSSRTQTT